MWPGYDNQYKIISDSFFSKQHILNQANSVWLLIFILRKKDKSSFLENSP